MLKYNDKNIKKIYLGNKKISKIFYNSRLVWSNNMTLVYKSDSNKSRASISLKAQHKYLVKMDKGGSATLEYNIFFAKRKAYLNDGDTFSTEQGAQLFYLTTAYPIKIYEYKF